MAENIIISIAAKIAGYIVAPVGQWLCYSCHYNSNIENLKKQKEKLQYARERVQDSVDAALGNGEKIYTDVTNWLTDVDSVTELATTKLRENEEAGTGSFNASCLNLKHRHQLSREAKKIVEAIAELHNNGNFKEVSKPALPLEEMDYNSNMENLKNQKEKLQHARERVQDTVDVALRNGEKIYPDVSKWLKDVDGLTELATTKLREIEEEAGTGSSNAACLNSEHRHQLSREAKKLVGDIVKLLKNGNFNGVSGHPASHYMVMNSRMAVVKDIMEALRSADIYKIGVWGMPGVGKSTLMEEIARQAKEEGIFNEVVVVLVTNNPVIRQIQGAIASTLGLNFDHETDKQKASLLQQRLSKDKKILVILDDIWKELGLQEIGIPSEGFKVVMTSRDRDVLNCGMGTQKVIELETLREEDALKLFEMRAGEIVRNPKVSGIAIEIVEKCAGLPIALVTVSKALKNKNLSEWKDALRRLKRPAPEHVTEMLKTIYSPIELSYDSLESQELKSLFLLCAQLPYFLDYRDLLKYSYGYGLSHGIYTLEEARATLDTLLRKLKDSCLLLESSIGFCMNRFCMHDLVRDVATIIASKNHNMFVMRDDGGEKAWPDVDALNRCEALSIHGGEIHKHPNKMECPELRFFHVNCKDSLNLKIPDIFFQGMDKLEVLSLRRMRLSSLFPLTNLQTLCLDGCELGDIHEIGDLKTLVILSLAYSDISNLPREIGSLTRLRLLDLNFCYKLRVIPPNVLSSLVNLEELYMRRIKVQWEVEGPSNEGKNSSLAELKKLSHLTTLEIEIPYANNLPANLFSEKLERYKICIGDEIDAWDFMREAAFSRVLKLNLNMSIQLDFGIKMLVKRTEYLHLDEANRKSVLYELDREDFQELKHLHIQKNGYIRHVLVSRTPDVAFPNLETFVLKDMISLEEICPGNLPLASFKNLKVLKVDNCEKLRFIFSSSIAIGLSLLEELNITRCDNMGAIFVKEEKDGIEDQGDTMLFDRLQTLVLKDLPKLVGFLSTKDSFMTDCRETNSEGNHDLRWPLQHHDQLCFPSVRELHLEGLPKIKHVWSKEPQTMFRFQALQDIYVGKCESLTSLFPAWVLRCLEQLKKIVIEDCGVEEIVAVEGGGGEAVERTLLFPQVTKLKFRNLPRLKWFYKGVHVSKWPMLKEMTIQGCHKVEIFASEVVSFEKTIQDQRQSEMSNIKQSLFLVDEHSFPSLETLEISKMDSLEIIFGKLEGQNGKEPQFFISSRSRTEESGAITNFASTVSFPSLQTLRMEDLLKIKHVWSEYSKIVFNFQNLQEIQAVRCESLKSFFPISVVSCLEQLQVLEIKDCGVEEIVAVGGGGEAVAVRTLVFPRVSTLKFRNLPRLKWFYKRVHVSKWPMLKKMTIQGCKKVEIFASEVVSFGKTVEDQRQSEMSNIKQPLFSVDELSFPILETLYIFNMDSLEIIFGKLEGQNGKEPQVLRSPASGTKESGATTHFASTLSFPSLKKLDISSMDKLEIIWQDQVTATSFPNIQDLTILYCHKLLHVFQSNLHTTTTTTLMQSLTRLVIVSCRSLETIFRNMEGQNGKEPQVLNAPSSGTEESVAREDGIARHIEFPALTELSLDELPKLKWIFEGVHTNLESWPSLKRLWLGKCGEQVNKMIWASKFASSSSSQENQLPTCIQQPMFVIELRILKKARM